MPFTKRAKIQEAQQRHLPEQIAYIPEENQALDSKRLRFLIFYTAGRLVHHARQTHLRVARAIEKIAAWKEAIRLLPLPT
jgi:hypothetical protein